MERSLLTPAFAATVFDSQKNRQTVILESAKQSDVPDSWVCDWHNLWKMTNFECEAVIKLSFNGKTKGLMRFGLYPYDGDLSKSPEYLEIRNLEALEGSTREVNPVGFWLIWYAVQVGLFICNEMLKVLSSLWMLLNIGVLTIEIRLRWTNLDRPDFHQARMDMLRGLRKKGHWRSAQDSKTAMDSQLVLADDDSCWESSEDDIVAGSEHEMNSVERYKFVQERTYGNSKTSEHTEHLKYAQRLLDEFCQISYDMMAASKLH